MEAAFITPKNNSYNKGMREYSKECNSTSSAFLDVASKDSTMESNVGSSYISNSTRRASFSSLSTNIKLNAKNGCQNSNEDNAYTGTEICVVCIRKGVKKKATHFCEDCDTRGRYMCYKCMNDHSNTWCQDHEVVSLSVGRRMEHVVWRHTEMNQQVTLGNTKSDYTHRWVQNATTEEENEYHDEFEDLNMASHVGTVGTNYSNYTRAVSDTDMLQRPQTPGPIHENIRDQHYGANAENSHPQNKDTVTNFASNSMLQKNNQPEHSHKEFNRVKNDTDILKRPRMPLPMNANLQDQQYVANSGNDESFHHSVSNSQSQHNQRGEHFEDYETVQNDEINVKTLSIQTDGETESELKSMRDYNRRAISSYPDNTIFQRQRMPVPKSENLQDQHYNASSGNSYPQNKDSLTHSASYSLLQHKQQRKEDVHDYRRPFEFLQNDETQREMNIGRDNQTKSEKQNMRLRANVIQAQTHTRRNQRRTSEVEEPIPEYTRERFQSDYFPRLSGIYKGLNGSYYLPRYNERREEHEYTTLGEKKKSCTIM